MERQHIQYYLQQSGMQPSQAEMLSAILGEMATRGEVKALQHSLEMQMQELRSEMRTELGEIRGEMRTELGDIRSEMRTELRDIRGEMSTEVGALRSEMHTELRDVRSGRDLQRADLVSELKALEARLTWRFIAGIAFFASVMTVLDVFVD